jgi:uncharacterized protein (TIGR03067 family)
MVVALDPSSEPKAIDMTEQHGERKVVTKGIYKLDGDTLTLRRATATGDVDRPHEFSTTPQEGLLVVFKRVSKK